VTLSSVELCAGAGGQAIGLEAAGFWHEALVEIDPDCCTTLRTNSPEWKIIEDDIRNVDGRQFAGIDLLAGGVPCQPFSVGGKQLGLEDGRNLFPQALRLATEIRPRAIMLENVAGLAQARFRPYRLMVLEYLDALGYTCWWQVEQSSWHGVPQLRPRMVLIGLKEPWASRFRWDYSVYQQTPTSAGMALLDLMGANGWPHAGEWATDRCTSIAPTLVGGSKKHGGPDLGPTRAREAWRRLGVNGSSIAETAPGPEAPHDHLPRLTVSMGGRLQGFPDDWVFTGRKTAAWRQVGNAFPPPVARDLGLAIGRALSS